MQNIILEYKLFLQEKKISKTSVKNYLVDARNFLEWFLLYVKTQNFEINDSRSSLFSYFSNDLVSKYKSFLIDNDTPVKTINRRLSGVRKLASYAVSQGWLTQNPAKSVSNVGVNSKGNNLHNNWTGKVVGEFARDLKKEGVSETTIKNYASDTSHFLSFINEVI